MHIHSEAFIPGYGDARIYFQAWETSDPAGSVIITHGQGEHSDCYSRVVTALKELPLNIYAWDMRGHGRSEGTRGYVKDFEEYCLDLEAFVALLKKEKKIDQKPVFMVAHSMGGLVQLKSLLDHPEWPVTAQVLSSPLMGLSKVVPAIKDLGALALNVMAPQVTLWNEIRNDDLTRDKEVLKEFSKDVFRHDRISSGAYLGFFAAQRSIQVRIKKLKVPTFLQISDKDPVVSTPKNRELYESLRGEKLKREYPNRKHEIYNDIEREVVLNDLKNFIAKYLK